MSNSSLSAADLAQKCFPLPGQHVWSEWKCERVIVNIGGRIAADSGGGEPTNTITQKLCGSVKEWKYCRVTLWAIGRHSDISIHEWSRLSPGNDDDCIRCNFNLFLSRPLLSLALSEELATTSSLNQTLKRKIGDKIAKLPVFAFLRALTVIRNKQKDLVSCTTRFLPGKDFFLELKSLNLLLEVVESNTDWSLTL